MNCPNCQTLLVENAKFCPKCGTPVSTPIMNSDQQQSFNNAVPMQQPINNGVPKVDSPKKNNITIILGVIIGLLIIVIIYMGFEISSYEDMYNSKKQELQKMEQQFEEYENRDAVDKTIDAIGSWLQY